MEKYQMQTTRFICLCVLTLALSAPSLSMADVVPPQLRKPQKRPTTKPAPQRTKPPKKRAPQAKKKVSKAPKTQKAKKKAPKAPKTKKTPASTKVKQRATSRPAKAKKKAPTSTKVKKRTTAKKQKAPKVAKTMLFPLVLPRDREQARQKKSVGRLATLRVGGWALRWMLSHKKPTIRYRLRIRGVRSKEYYYLRLQTKEVKAKLSGFKKRRFLTLTVKLGPTKVHLSMPKKQYAAHAAGGFQDYMINASIYSVR